MLEVGVLYSVGFNRFMDRVGQLTERDITDKMRTAHDHWVSVTALKSELDVEKS